MNRGKTHNLFDCRATLHVVPSGQPGCSDPARWTTTQWGYHSTRTRHEETLPFALTPSRLFIKPLSRMTQTDEEQIPSCFASANGRSVQACTLWSESCRFTLAVSLTVGHVFLTKRKNVSELRIDRSFHLHRFLRSSRKGVQVSGFSYYFEDDGNVAHETGRDVSSTVLVWFPLVGPKP